MVKRIFDKLEKQKPRVSLEDMEKVLMTASERVANELVKVAKDLEDGWEEVGQLAVDSGILMVGDPAYLPSYSDDDRSDSFGKDWQGFLDNQDYVKEPVIIKNEHANLAIAWPNGGGDMGRTVSVKRNSDGLVEEVKIASELLRVAQYLIS